MVSQLYLLTKRNGQILIKHSTGLSRTYKRALILSALDSTISDYQVLPVLTVGGMKTSFILELSNVS